MNSEQFNLLLGKLEKLQKEREREDVGPPLKHDPDRAPSKSKRNAPSKYPHDITKYEVTETLGAGTFGRVKQVLSPNK